MIRFVYRAVSVMLVSFAVAGAGTNCWQVCSAQEELIERPGPPAVDELELDQNNDGVPDGWYNARDARWMAEGGVPGVGPHFVRFECKEPGRPARLQSRFRS